MPEMDGPTLVQHVRILSPELKVIFISGYAEDAFRQQVDQNETIIFLPKPFSLQALATVVKMFSRIEGIRKPLKTTTTH